MALFRLTKIAEPEPLLRGDGLYLRPAVAGGLSRPGRSLRAESREFLTPWEPTWPADDLTRAAFRRRLRRQIEEIARDESFSFLIFDAATDALLGGLTLGGIRRGVAQAATLGYWMGAPHAGKGHMTRAVGGGGALRLLDAAAASDRGGVPARERRLDDAAGAQRLSARGLARAYLSINGAWRDHCCMRSGRDPRRRACGSRPIDAPGRRAGPTRRP